MMMMMMIGNGGGGCAGGCIFRGPLCFGLLCCACLRRCCYLFLRCILFLFAHSVPPRAPPRSYVSVRPALPRRAGRRTDGWMDESADSSRCVCVCVCRWWFSGPFRHRCSCFWLSSAAACPLPIPIPISIPHHPVGSKADWDRARPVVQPIAMAHASVAAAAACLLLLSSAIASAVPPPPPSPTPKSVQHGLPPCTVRGS